MKNFASRYKHMSEIAVANNLPLILLETNTAACGGFLGLSGSFLATLWSLDLGMQLASAGFLNMMFHIGVQNVYYNVRSRSHEIAR